MMTPSLMRSLWLAFLLVLSVRGGAQVNSDIVQRGKQATALVEIEGGAGFGTAFCIDRAGIFVTNDHVAEAAGPTTRLSLVLHPGEKEQRKLAARVLRRDHAADLALLQVETREKLTALELGESETLLETADVVVFGYPFGNALAVGNENYPAVTISTGRITALRKESGQLTRIQFDASVTHGSSGGPLLNTKGQVVGIVAAGIEGARINIAIPTRALRSLMRQITIFFTPTPIPANRQHQKRDFTINLASLTPLPADVQVKFTLTAGTGPPRSFVAHRTDGDTFQAAAIPVPPSDESGSLQLAIQDTDSEIVCSMKDREIVIAGKTLPLRQVSDIEFGASPRVTLRDGQVLLGMPHGLESVPLHLAGDTVSLNLNKVTRIRVTDLSSGVASVLYHIGVFQGQHLLAETSGTLDIVGEEGPPLQELTLTGAVLFSLDEDDNADGISFWTTGGADSYQLFLRQGTKWLNAANNTIKLPLTLGLNSFEFYIEPGEHRAARYGFTLFFNDQNHRPGLSVRILPVTTRGEKSSWTALTGKSLGVNHSERLAPGTLVSTQYGFQVEFVGFELLDPSVEKADLVSGFTMQPNGTPDMIGRWSVRVTRRRE